jgi:hypothetical protein
MHGEAGGDVKFIWELNRHEHLVRLAQAYHLTRREHYAERVAQLLDSWMEQNPPGIGINWTSSLEIAIRAVAWCWAWRLTRSAPIWTDDRTSRFLWTLWHHASHVERFDSIHHSPNTHLTGEAIGLLYVGALIPEFQRAARWRWRAFATLIAEIDQQVLPDGMHFERSTGYHRYTLEFYLHAYLLARDYAPHACDALQSAIVRLADAAVALRRPDGSWPVLGDEDGGRLLRLGQRAHVDQNPLLGVAAALFDRPDWLGRDHASALDEAWWLLEDDRLRGIATARAEADAGADTSLPRAGYYVVRDPGASPWYCLVDAGPHGGERTGHAHSDIGHVEIAMGDRLVLCDPGSPTYTGDLRQRTRFRGEWVHACLCSVAAPMAEETGPFSWRSIPAPPEVSTFDDGSVWTANVRSTRVGVATRLTHHRQVMLDRGVGVTIRDYVSGVSGHAVDVRWPLAFGPDEITLEESSGSVRLRAADIVIECRWQTCAPASVTLEPAVRSPTYGRVVPSSILVLRFAPPIRIALVTRFRRSTG